MGTGAIFPQFMQLSNHFLILKHFSRQQGRFGAPLVFCMAGHCWERGFLSNYLGDLDFIPLNLYLTCYVLRNTLICRKVITYYGRHTSGSSSRILHGQTLLRVYGRMLMTQYKADYPQVRLKIDLPHDCTKPSLTERYIIYQLHTTDYTLHTAEKHHLPMFHTPTVRPKRLGPRILYDTSLRYCV